MLCLPKPCLVTLQKVDVLKNCSRKPRVEWKNHPRLARVCETLEKSQSHFATRCVFTELPGGVVAFGSTSLHEQSLVSGKYDF